MEFVYNIDQVSLYHLLYNVVKTESCLLFPSVSNYFPS